MANRIKLLVVDDEVRFLNTLTRRLSLRDFDVTTATSGREALDLADGQNFDLVLLNLKSGEEALNVLKERYPLTEVVILSGHGSIESAVERTPTGSYIYLQKPVETTELLRVLKDAYQRRLQRKMALSEQKLLELSDISLGESPLSILRKLKVLDGSR
jgi:DNA-binding NtrC family response regulator